jgi:hypothetical protein
MKRIQSLLLILGTLCTATCFAFAPSPTVATTNDGSSSVAIDAHDANRIVATIRGSSGVADVQGDKVELRDRIVYVNARSYGQVPARCEITYVVAKDQRQLLVNGKLRAPLLAAK